jgi:hypothetical protein
MIALRTAALALAVPLGACGAPVAAPAVPDCPADRAVVVAGPADLARLASCATLGGLTVRTGAALDVSQLRALTAITGDLVIGPTVAIEDVHLGPLRTVGGAIRVVGNGLLRGLYLPRLERAGGIDIDGNAAVTTISLPHLQVVHGALRITGNAEFELLDIAALASIDRELVIAGAPGLTLVEAAQLQHAAAVRIDAPSLPPDVADRLRRAGAR